MCARFEYKEVPASALDSFHSLLMDDDEFNEACMRVALQVAESYLQRPGGGVYDEDQLYDLAMELCTKVTIA